MLSHCLVAEICKNSLNQSVKIYVVSDTNTKISGTNVESNAVATRKGGWSANISEATWIWNNYIASNYVALTFKVQFFLPGIVLSGILRVAFDDYLSSVYVNNKITECKFLSYSGGSEKNCDLTTFLESGMNTILFNVKNLGGYAGLLYLLNVSIAI